MIGVEPLPTGVACPSPDPPGVPRAGVLGAAGLLRLLAPLSFRLLPVRRRCRLQGWFPPVGPRPLLGYEASTFIDLLEDEEEDAVKRAIMHEAR